VYRAVSTSVVGFSDVALKMLTSVPLSDFERVAQRCDAIAEVHHPNIMRQGETFIGPALWSDAAPDPDEFDLIYSVASWVPGESLKEAVRHVDCAVGLSWTCQIARAVQYLHDFASSAAPDGIIHRDIKPSNVRIQSDGAAILIDFGMARPHSDNDLSEGIGTYLWRAPEVLGGPGTPGPASDRWGVGALAYWVLMGEPTRLEGASVARERLLLKCRELGLSDPATISTLISGLLESHPNERINDLNVWADHLEASLRGSSVSVTKRRRAPAKTMALPLAESSIDYRSTRTKDSSTPQEPRTPTTAGVKPHRRRLRRGIAVVIVFIVILGACAFVVEDVLGSSQPPAVATYVFPSRLYSPGLVVHRTWTLSGPSDDLLQSKLTMSNDGQTKLATTYEEAIPKQVASSIKKLRFAGATHHVVQADPVVSYQMKGLKPGATIQASYEVTLTPSNVTPSTRIKTLAAVQIADEDALVKKVINSEGVALQSNQTVLISCRTRGFSVSDGNAWWYRIDSKPWNNVYWVSADAFYNDGQDSGSLVGTPFYDPEVPTCSQTLSASTTPTSPTFHETTGSAANTWANYSDPGGQAIPPTSTKSGPAPLTWNFEDVDANNGLLSISCPSVELCVAGDSGGHVVTYQDGTWGQATLVDSSGGFMNSVSCAQSASTVLCAAVDNEGYAVMYRAGSWGQPTKIDPGGDGLVRVSCATVTFCVAVDADGSELTYSGTTWSNPNQIDNSGGELWAISCPTSRFCGAFDLAGNVTFYNGTSWSESTRVDSNGGVIGGTISCPTSKFCAVSDSIGDVITYNGVNWSQPVKVDANRLTSISCQSSQSCTALDYAGNVLTFNGNEWSSLEPLTPVSVLWAVSCPSTSFCSAVGDGGIFDYGK
jgi:serine/threonine protein kinase